MNKYTPGPWEVGRFSGDTVWAEGGHTLLASCNYLPEGEIETEKANARLIAAAPQIFEALKAMVKAGRGDDGPYCDAKDLLAKLE